MASMVPHKFPLCTTEHRRRPTDPRWVTACCEEEKLSIASPKLEFRMRAFSVIFSVTAWRVHGYTPASLWGHRPNIFFRQWKRNWAFSGWQAWSFARFFDETSAEVDCATMIAVAELAIRTVLFAPATPSGERDEFDNEDVYQVPEKLEFATGDKIGSHDGHLKVSRGELVVGELVGATCTTLACWRITQSVSMCLQYGTVTRAFFLSLLSLATQNGRGPSEQNSG